MASKTFNDFLNKISEKDKAQLDSAIQGLANNGASKGQEVQQGEKWTPKDSVKEQANEVAQGLANHGIKMQDMKPEQMPQTRHRIGNEAGELSRPPAPEMPATPPAAQGNSKTFAEIMNKTKTETTPKPTETNKLTQ